MDLTGFLFGNVNEEGELEDESILDKVLTLIAKTEGEEMCQIWRASDCLKVRYMWRV